MSRNGVYNFLSGLFRRFPLKKKTVMFLSYYGAQYGCNPKYLSDYFVREHPEWDVVWGFTDPKAHSTVLTRKVRYLSVRYFYELATCRVFVTNYRTAEYYKRRKGQLYVQTWHSSLRLKAIEADAGDSVSDSYKRMAQHDSRQISILLSGCEKSSEIFRRAFWYDGDIVSTGTPRMDILFSKNTQLKTEIKRKLCIENSYNIVTFAPTFRENRGCDFLNLDLRLLHDCLHDKWGGDWAVLLRLHPHMRNYIPSIDNQTFPILDVTRYDDIQELLFISDVVISDYSSLIFDFAYTKRPCFLYTPDLDEYLRKERQLYFSLGDLPFPVIHDNKEMAETINDFDTSFYRARIDTFLQVVGSFETGHACENVFNTIANLCS